MSASRRSGVLLLCLAWAASSMAAAPAHPGQQVFIGAFDVGPSGNAQRFNPLVAGAGFGFYNKYFSTLALYDAGFQNLSGDLAESWRFSADGKRLTITLRKDVKWHDGKPFGAADVKFTLDLVRNAELGSAFAARLAAVTEVRAVDAATVVLELGRPDRTLPDAFTSIMIVPQHLLGRMSARELRNAAWWKAPVGTGPFKWRAYLPDQYVELEAYPHFHRGRPKLDRLVNRYFRDGSAAALALAAGDIHFTHLSTDQARENTSKTTFDVRSGPSHVLNYLGLNDREPRFRDVRVRQAILLAIDRQAITKSLYHGGATPANCVLTAPRYQSARVAPYHANAAQARALLAAADWEGLNKGQPVELLTYYNDQVTKDTIAVFQAMLAQVGIRLQPRFVDGPTYGQLVDAGRFSMVFAGALNGPDPGALAPLLHSAHLPPMGANRMRIRLPALDALLDAGQATADDTRRTAIYQDVCALTNARLPWIPLWTATRYGGFARNVKDIVWTPAPAGGRYQDYPERWQLR